MTTWRILATPSLGFFSQVGWFRRRSTGQRVMITCKLATPDASSPLNRCCRRRALPACAISSLGEGTTMGRTIGRFGVVVAAFLCIVGSHDALAQSAAGCSLQQVGGTQRQILHCGEGIAITAEAGARYQLIDRNRDG